ncbi:MAG: AbrB/MazE/SpoVT family DNA-binding domain-containing protein [Nitrospinota bacterium]
MALIRGFTTVDKEGKVPLPRNVQVSLDLKPGQLVELKVVGGNKLVIQKRKQIR